MEEKRLCLMWKGFEDRQAFQDKIQKYLNLIFGAKFQMFWDTCIKIQDILAESPFSNYPTKNKKRRNLFEYICQESPSFQNTNDQ